MHTARGTLAPERDEPLTVLLVACFLFPGDGGGG